MKSFFGKLSARFPFFANRPSALEHAVRQSPKSRRLRMEPLENRALLAVDAFGGAASLIDSDVGENWGPDPAPAACAASVLATDAAIVDVSGVNATLDAASFSVQAETPEPVAPPSFDQLMESLGMIEIESLDEFDAASSSFLDDASDETAATSDAVVRRVVFEGSDVEAESLDEPVVVVPTATGAANVYVDAYSATPANNATTETSTPLTNVTVFECDNVSGGATTTLTPLSTPYFDNINYDLFMRCSLTQDEMQNDFQIVSVISDGSGGTSAFGPISGGGSEYIPVSGGTSFAILPTNDFYVENEEVFQILFYTKPAGSGGNDAPYTLLPNTGYEIKIVDDDQWKTQITSPQTCDVYEPRVGSTLSAQYTEFTLERVANETASELQDNPLVNYTLDSSYAINVKLKFTFDNGAEPSDFRLEKYSSSNNYWETVNLTQAYNDAYTYIDIAANQTEAKFRISGIADDRIEGRENIIISIDSSYAGTTANSFEIDSTKVFTWIYESPEFRNNISELRVTTDSTNLGSLLAFPSVGDEIFDFTSWGKNISYSAGQTIGYVLSGEDAEYFEIDQENQCVRWKKTPTGNDKISFNFVLKAFDVERAKYLYDELKIEFWLP